MPPGRNAEANLTLESLKSLTIPKALFIFKGSEILKVFYMGRNTSVRRKGRNIVVPAFLFVRGEERIHHGDTETRSYLSGENCQSGMDQIVQLRSGRIPAALACMRIKILIFSSNGRDASRLISSLCWSKMSATVVSMMSSPGTVPTFRSSRACLKSVSAFGNRCFFWTCPANE